MARNEIFIDIPRAKAGPLGAATITFHLQPEGNGTRVIMVEDPVERWRALALGPLGHFIVRARNAASVYARRRRVAIRRITNREVSRAAAWHQERDKARPTVRARQGKRA